MLQTLCTSADPEIVKGETMYQPPSSFIVNAHNELICLLYGKRWITEKFWRPMGAAPTPPPLNPPLLR